MSLTAPSKAQNLVTEWPITLGWDASPEEDLAGYRLYQREVSFAGIVPYGLHVADIPAGTQLVEILITSPVAQYFILTAYDSDGNESGASNEISYTPDNVPPGAPYIRFIFQLSGSGG